jgi:hypothetical protein
VSNSQNFAGGSVQFVQTAPPACVGSHAIVAIRRFLLQAAAPGSIRLLSCGCFSLWYNPTCKNGFIEVNRLFVSQEPALKIIVMLKRLSEALSQSNIESNPQASEIHCSHHSSCNFSANPVSEMEINCFPSQTLSNYVTRGQQSSRK